MPGTPSRAPARPTSASGTMPIRLPTAIARSACGKPSAGTSSAPDTMTSSPIERSPHRTLEVEARQLPQGRLDGADAPLRRLAFEDVLEPSRDGGHRWRGYRTGPMAMTYARSDRWARDINIRITGRYARAASSPTSGTWSAMSSDHRNRVPPSTSSSSQTPAPGHDAAVTDLQPPRWLPHRDLHRLRERRDPEQARLDGQPHARPPRDARRRPRHGRRRASIRPAVPSRRGRPTPPPPSWGGRSRAPHACVECMDDHAAPGRRAGDR